MANLGERIVDKFISLIEEYGSSLAADLTSKWLLHKPLDTELVKKVGELVSQGKQEEARKALQPAVMGIGYKDETIVLFDLVFLRRQNLITRAQSLALARFFAGLSDNHRTRFRHGYTQADERERRAMLEGLAKLPTTREKRQYLVAAGYFEPSPAERLEEIARDANRRITTWDRLQQRRNRPVAWHLNFLGRRRNITWLRTALLFPIRPITAILEGFSLPRE